MRTFYYDYRLGSSDKPLLTLVVAWRMAESAAGTASMPAGNNNQMQIHGVVQLNMDRQA
jgi:hypothetical protein